MLSCCTDQFSDDLENVVTRSLGLVLVADDLDDVLSFVPTARQVNLDVVVLADLVDHLALSADDF